MLSSWLHLAPFVSQAAVVLEDGERDTEDSAHSDASSSNDDGDALLATGGLDANGEGSDGEGAGGREANRWKIQQAVEWLEQAVARGERRERQGQSIESASLHATLLLAGCLTEGLAKKDDGRPLPGGQRSVRLLRWLVVKCREADAAPQPAAVGACKVPATNSAPGGIDAPVIGAGALLRQALYKLGVVLVGLDRADGGLDEAVKVFREGAQLGDVRCMVNFASLQMRRTAPLARVSGASTANAGASSGKKGAEEQGGLSEALQWLHSAADTGSGAALLNLGLWHLGAKKEGAYLDYLQRAARAGDVVALLMLGKEYASGERLVRDDTAATHWLLTAAEAELDAVAVGSPRALSGDDWFVIASRVDPGATLGAGDDCDVDLRHGNSKAVQYLKEARALGNSDARVRLAQVPCVREGEREVAGGGRGERECGRDAKRCVCVY